jgi:V8-like Glu-specific endopeptidase
VQRDLASSLLRRPVALPWVLGACAAAGLLDACDGEHPVAAERHQIVGGTPDTSHLSVVALAEGGTEFCSGTVIAPRAVLTAAHCYAHQGRQPTNTVVVVGPSLDAASASLAVTEGYLDPDYYMDDARGAPMNDVAVLVLGEDAPVPAVPWQHYALSGLEGEAVTLVGYGVTDPATLEGRGVRRVVDQTVLQTDETFIYYSGNANGTCAGDSGGPMFLDVKGTAVLLGITSYGDETCVGFGANTRVDRYVDFINAHAPGSVATPKQPVTVAISAPTDGAVVEGPVSVTVDAQSRAGIASIEVLVDGATRGRLDQLPWELALGDLTGGAHEIVATAEAMDGASGSATVRIVVNGPVADGGASQAVDGGGCAVRESGPGAAISVLLLAFLRRRLRARRS